MIELGYINMCLEYFESKYIHVHFIYIKNSNTFIIKNLNRNIPVAVSDYNNVVIQYNDLAFVVNMKKLKEQQFVAKKYDEISSKNIVDFTMKIHEVNGDSLDIYLSPLEVGIADAFSELVGEFYDRQK